MKDEIFLSYARKDREWAKIFEEALENAGYSVWCDRKMLGGQNIRTVIKEKLDTAKCVILQSVAEMTGTAVKKKVVKPVTQPEKPDKIEIKAVELRIEEAALKDREGKEREQKKVTKMEQELEKQLNNLYDEGVRTAEDKNWDGAISAFEQVVAIEYRYRDAAIRLSLASAEKQKDEERRRSKEQNEQEKRERRSREETKITTGKEYGLTARKKEVSL